MEREISERANECPICAEETPALYQCCPNQKDSLCESCWTQLMSAVIQKGKIGLVLTGKLTCDYCHEPIERDRLPQAIQTQINNVLLTIPKTKNPKSIEEFNYSYNQSHELRNKLTDEKFVFISQRHYNLLGSCLDEYIQSLMKNDPWNYEEIWLPIKEQPTNDHHDQVNIFTSNDFQTNENGCLILIQGSGVVRPGQWARSCCINDSLDIGTMFPYMTKAKEHNLSVIILNPNQTSYIDEQPSDTEDANTSNKEEGIAGEGAVSTDKQIPGAKKDTVNQDDELISFYLSPKPLPCPSTKKIPNLSTNREHILYVYDNIISKCPAKQFYIVAHSAGGDGLMYLLRKRPDNILPTIAKIAFTDSVHSILPFEPNQIKTFIKTNAIHFVASDEPMGEPVDSAYDFSGASACQEVSAGHPKHEYTSGHCVEGVFKFFFPSDKTNEEGIDRTKL